MTYVLINFIHRFSATSFQSDHKTSIYIDCVHTQKIYVRRKNSNNNIKCFFHVTPSTQLKLKMYHGHYLFFPIFFYLDGLEFPFRVYYMVNWFEL
jgi:hypothetical protein